MHPKAPFPPLYQTKFMPFSFDLESLRKEHQCKHYFETGLWDPQYDVSSKQALRSNFEYVFCMEIHPEWIQRGKEVFSEEISNGRYHLIESDSAYMKHHIQHPCFRDRCMFFLDAHVDNDRISSHTTRCPLLDELDAIQHLERNDHVILIDDLRILSHPHPWGETRYGAISFLDKIKERLLIINPNYQFKTLHGIVADDILCAYVSSHDPIKDTHIQQVQQVQMKEESSSYLPDGFVGEVYRISTNWFEAISLPSPPQPQHILEIGVYHGANVCSLLKTYASHPDSTIHCIDPWSNYQGYSEYPEQARNYSYFIQNLSKLTPEELYKIHIHRGLSEVILPQLKDDMFDIIFIDGNHDKRYVLHDAIMSLKKVKHGGYILFDDMQCEDVRRSVEIFIYTYRKNIETIKDLEGQFVIQIKKEI